MKLLELTLDEPEHNLALDEAILNAVDQGDCKEDVLRLWEPQQSFVVLGRASKFHQEVQSDFCNENDIKTLRRCSGGATIVAGPGCFMYAVIGAVHRHHQFRNIDSCHHFVLNTIRDQFCRKAANVQIQGTSDLTIQGRKFSGNSLRCKRNAILYHGTVLYDADLQQISKCLKMPPRQPDYRNQKEHLNFLTNVPIHREELVEMFRSAWNAKESFHAWPRDETAQLVKERYSTSAWNRRH